MLLAICSSVVACADASEFAPCNPTPVDVELWNRSQFEVLRFELDGENMLTAPLGVEERVSVTGFADAQEVSFTRLHEDTGREVRVQAPGNICLAAGDTLVLFDDSFRLPTATP